MKKKVAKRTRRTPATSKGERLAVLVAEVRGLIQSARNAAASAVNLLQVLTNFEIGRRIVQHEQEGARRAGYGQEMLKALSSRLTAEFGKGFSVTNLQLMRKFFLEYQSRIQQQPAVELGRSPTSPGTSTPIQLWQKPCAEFANPFTLSYGACEASHLLQVWAPLTVTQEDSGFI